MKFNLEKSNRGRIEVPRAGFDPASPTRKASILSILSSSQFDRVVRPRLYTTGARSFPPESG